MAEFEENRVYSADEVFYENKLLIISLKKFEHALSTLFNKFLCIFGRLF